MVSARTARALPFLAPLVVLALLVGCGTSDGAETRAVPEIRIDGVVVETSGDDVADRIRSLGTAGFTKSPPPQEQRLAAGLAPDPDAPLFVGDYADPFVLTVGDDIYLYTTNTLILNVPVLGAEAGQSAVTIGDALPRLPAWTSPGMVWAPSVLAVDGGYVLYYTSRHDDSGLQCVGVAASEKPQGPYVPLGDEPFVCQLDLGGTIDASPYRSADGRTWLLYKNDGNCCDIPTAIWSQELSADGRSLVGEPHALIATSEEWEGPLVEGPSMVEVDGHHWLLYSANDWNSPHYATGIARCESPEGPCEKDPAPWLSNHGTASGPGGLETFTDSQGRDWVIYHAWVGDTIGYEQGGVRALFAARLDPGEDRPHVRGISR